MIHMAWRTCVLLVPSKISPLSFHTTQKEPLIVDVRNPDFIICADWFHCFRFCQWLISCIAQQTTPPPWFVCLGLFADNMTEALLFLSHFMGDIHQVCGQFQHLTFFYSSLWIELIKDFFFSFYILIIFLCIFWQPMHVGFTTDEGGNTIDLRWFRHKSNLHHVSPFTCSYIDLLNRQTRLPEKQKGLEKPSNIVWQEEKILLFLMSYVGLDYYQSINNVCCVNLFVLFKN